MTRFGQSSREVLRYSVPKMLNKMTFDIWIADLTWHISKVKARD